MTWTVDRYDYEYMEKEIKRLKNLLEIEDETR
jgi:hypothetical protein